MKKINLWIGEEHIEQLERLGRRNKAGDSENIRRAITFYFMHGLTAPLPALSDGRHKRKIKFSSKRKNS